jgi:phytoene synthase
MTPDEAFRICGEIAAKHYENFPVASLFLPEERRPYIQAIYAFSRMADDFADEPGMVGAERIARLRDWELMLEECYQGRAEHPVFVALGETVRKNRIPIGLLKDLLAAFTRDVRQNRYETYDELLDYCRCSANPIGRLVLMVFGHADERLFALSDRICTALQLTNFWQDIFVDLEKDRLYLPLEEMRRFGYTPGMWKNGETGPPFRELMAFQVERTKALFYDGAELPELVEKDLQVELKLVWLGGMSILDRISKRGVTPARRPSIGGPGKLIILLRALTIRRLGSYRRKKKPWDLT